MLKSLSQPSLSPASAASSPNLKFQQYHIGASPTLRTSTNNLPRRKSFVPEQPEPAPTRGSVQYVDRGTQCSPALDQASALPRGLALGEPHQSQSGVPDPVPTVVAAAPPPPPTAIATNTALEVDSPSMKKRTSPDELPSIVKSDDALPSKRAKEAPSAVKVLPAKYEYCEVGDLVVLIANMISELIETNDGLPLRSGVLTRFHSRTPPGISVVDYLQRLAKHATLTPPILLSMVYYIDRLCSLYPAFTITTLTVHRFLITAATVAAKGLSDSFWNNATYARVGGIKLAELGLLELDFLYRVDWKIVPNPEVLVDYYRGLIERSTIYELASDSSSDEDDEDDLSESTDPQNPPPTRGAATDVQWKAWMDDVSKEKAIIKG